MMLQWMNEAERKWKDKNKEQQMNHTDENSYQFEANEDPVEILDEGELYEYLALANFTVSFKSLFCLYLYVVCSQVASLYQFKERDPSKEFSRP